MENEDRLDGLLELTNAYINDCANFIESEIQPGREKAIDYYNGKTPYNLPNIDGRSKVVDNIVRDNVEWTLPQMMRIFASGDRYVSVDPHGVEDTDKAELTEEWVNHVINVQNNGFLEDYQWIKDALIEKVGWQKAWWNVSTKVETASFQGITDSGIEALKAQDGITVIKEERAEIEEGSGAYVSSVEIEIEKQDANICISTVPPEEVLYPQSAKLDRSTWEFIAHKCRKTISDIREMGFEIEDDLPGYELEGTDNIERASDSPGADIDEDAVDTQDFPWLRKVWLYEIYIKLDEGGDGRSRWRQMFRVGPEFLSSQGESDIYMEYVEEPLLYCISPILRSHRLTGYSLADLTMDIQEVQTALLRNVNDHLYQTVSPRQEVDMTGVSEWTLDDLLNKAPGSPVRVRKPGTIRPLSASPLPPYAFNLIEHWDERNQKRTGVTEFSQGLSPDALTKTATGTSLVMQAGNQRPELIARTFAETGFRDRVRLIIQLSAKYPEYLTQRTIKLSGQPLQFTADDLVQNYDLVINTGIGNGNRGEQMMFLTKLTEAYQSLIQQGAGPGSDTPLFSMRNVYNALTEMAKVSGFRNYSDFFIDPKNPAQERDPPREKTPPIEQILAQVEGQKNALKAKEAAANHELKMREHLLNAKEAESDARIEEQKLIISLRELELKEREISIKERELGIKEAEATVGMAGDAADMAAKAAEPKEVERGDDGLIMAIGGEGVERDENGMIVSVGGRKVNRNESGRIVGIGGAEDADGLG